jgi:SAM-dependent methyltransferase
MSRSDGRARCGGRSQPGGEVAARNLTGREASIFQADVFHLPFATESFDYLYSIGVLHPTPDCGPTFKMLPGLVKPGGRIAIWLHSVYNRWYKMSDVYRKVTRRMSPRMRHTLCYGVVPLYGIHQVLQKIPLGGRTWRILDTFDWYSPWYQSKHTYEELFRWLESCGLEDLRVIDQPVTVPGRRPLTVDSEKKHPAEEVSQCAG